MSDFTIHDLRPGLEERIRGLAELQNLPVDKVANDALSLGVEAIEDRMRKQLLDTREQVALQEAIEHIRKVPDDAFGKIGRTGSG